MPNDIKGRKFQLTINNPTEHGLTREQILQKLSMLKTDYFCMADEVGLETNTPHTHIFLYVACTTRFSTIKNVFPQAHIEKVNGTVLSNIDYILKRGKWEQTEKAETTIEGSFYECGSIPLERDNSNKSGLPDLIEWINQGLSIGEILSLNPNYGFRIKEIEILRETLLSEKYTKEKRSVITTYIYGAHNTGKTQSIYNDFLSSDICRISIYPSKGVKFDAYAGHDVLVFDNFDSQIPLPDMVEYMSGFPLKLSARYNDKVACYTHLFIISNIPVQDTYYQKRVEKPALWKNFYNRIDYLYEQISETQRIPIPKETLII